MVFVLSIGQTQHHIQDKYVASLTHFLFLFLHSLDLPCFHFFQKQI